MTTTTNLAIQHIETAQAQKEVTANEAFATLDSAIAGTVAIALPTGATQSTVMTNVQFANRVIKLAGALTAGQILQLPSARSGLWAVNNATTGGQTITFRIGAAGATTAITATGYKHVHSDGAAIAQF